MGDSERQPDGARKDKKARWRTGNAAPYYTQGPFGIFCWAETSREPIAAATRRAGKFPMPKEPVRFLAESRMGSRRVDQRRLGIQMNSPALQWSSSPLRCGSDGRPRAGAFVGSAVAGRPLAWVLVDGWRKQFEDLMAHRHPPSHETGPQARHPTLLWRWIRSTRYAISGRYASSQGSMNIVERFNVPLLRASVCDEIDNEDQLALKTLSSQSPIEGWIQLPAVTL